LKAKSIAAVFTATLTITGLKWRYLPPLVIHTNVALNTATESK